MQFATWNPDSSNGYVRAKCKYVGQYENEIHVELLRNELCQDTADIFIAKAMEDALAYQDQFEVFIQTMISKALDSNFLTEIMQEQGASPASFSPSLSHFLIHLSSAICLPDSMLIQFLRTTDDYFLSNVKTIDDLNMERRERVRSTVSFPPLMVRSLETWPCYNIHTDLGVTNNGQIICAGCSKRAVVSRLILGGQAYNTNTIDPIQLDSRISSEKVTPNEKKKIERQKIPFIYAQFVCYVVHCRIS